LKVGGDLIDIILAILLLSVIILVHEFGHFILAKANGVMVVEFSLGFGPKLLHFKKGETEYSLKLLPFGGACMMLGEDYDADITDDEKSIPANKQNIKKNANNYTSANTYTNANTNANINVNTNDKNITNDKALKKQFDMSRAFSSKSVWARMSILAAGPIFNFLLAFILSVIIIGCLGYDPCTVDKINADSPATVAGLQEGDLITSINGRDITFTRELSLYRTLYPEKTMDITYVRAGEKHTTTLTPQYNKNSTYRVGITISNCVVNSVSADSPAKKSGLKVNDLVKSVDGQQITSSDQLSEILAVTGSKEVTMLVERDGKEVSLNVTPELTESETYYTGFFCYGQRVKTTPIHTLGYGVKEVGYWIRTVFDSLGMLVGGKVSLNDVAGPVGVVNVIGNVVEQSKPDGAFYIMLNLFNMAVMISANLGVMNLLPIPALDGGRLVFCIIEAVRGKPINKEKEGMVHFVGMILLMVLMVLILFNDVKNIFM